MAVKVYVNGSLGEPEAVQLNQRGYVSNVVEILGDKL